MGRRKDSDFGVIRDSDLLVMRFGGVLEAALRDSDSLVMRFGGCPAIVINQ